MSLMWKSLILLCQFALTHLQLDDFACSDQFPLITDLQPEDCDANEKYYYKETGSDNGCFPSCVKIDINLGVDWCTDLEHGCPTGYYCDETRNRCTLDLNSCHKYYVDANNIYTRAMWKPQCLPDGSWAPKQCKGEPAHGRCFCFDAVGNRIFGHAFSNQAANMTCACSRRRAELEAAGDRYFISLHCDSMGNYEELQCDSGQCWCVEPTTGDVTAPVVPESLMTYLPCYDEKEVGEQYLRQCESQYYAQEKIRNEFNIHGTTRVNFPLVLCDPDGSYGTYKIINAIAYCTWRDNSAIGSFQIQTSSGIAGMNCNCARDTKLYETNGQTQSLLCMTNGNYDPVQQDGLLFYCVDSDGFPKSAETNDPNIDCNNYV